MGLEIRQGIILMALQLEWLPHALMLAMRFPSVVGSRLGVKQGTAACTSAAAAWTLWQFQGAAMQVGSLYACLEAHSSKAGGSRARCRLFVCFITLCRAYAVAVLNPNSPTRCHFHEHYLAHAVTLSARLLSCPSRLHRDSSHVCRGTTIASWRASCLSMADASP